MRRATWRVAVVAALGLALAVTTAAAEWELLGRRTVDMKGDHDTIAVGAEKGAFTRVKLGVRERGIRLRDLEVVFADDSVQRIKIRRHLKPGQETRAIDLDGAARRIRRVELTYRTRGRGTGRAVVQLFGFEAVEGPERE